MTQYIINQILISNKYKYIYIDRPTMLTLCRMGIGVIVE